MLSIAWIIVIIIAVLVLFAVIIYNGIVRLSNEIKNSWAQIDVQLKRRNDLIPNLVSTVKGYAKHERQTLNEVTNARKMVDQATGVKEKAEASNMLSNTLKSLFAVSENYPDLKANQNFLQLQEELTGTENKISYSRQHYNDVVMKYNNKLQVFPNSLFASMFNFKEEKSFEAPEAEKKNVKVEF